MRGWSTIEIPPLKMEMQLTTTDNNHETCGFHRQRRFSSAVPKKSQLEKLTNKGLKIEGIQNHQTGFVRFGSLNSVKFMNCGKCQNFHMTLTTCSLKLLSSSRPTTHTLNSSGGFEGMYIYIYIYMYQLYHLVCKYIIVII